MAIKIKILEHSKLYLLTLDTGAGEWILVGIFAKEREALNASKYLEALIRRKRDQHPDPPHEIISMGKYRVNTSEYKIRIQQMTEGRLGLDETS
jgi:hypothetical protein